MTTNEELRELLLTEHTDVEARIADLEATLRELVHSREESNDDDEHDPEGVTLSSEWSRLSGLADAARAELSQVTEALQRWEVGSYGVCERCGNDIPRERLAVRPYATQCVPCASGAR